MAGFTALRKMIFLAVLMCVSVFGTLSAQAMPFEVTNIQVTAQSTDAVKAREAALAQAQRKAFAVLVGQDETQIESITDAQIARLIRGFSVRQERLAARAYTANFTIRFNPNATIGFVQQNGLYFAHAGQNGPIDANPSGKTASRNGVQEPHNGAEQDSAGQDIAGQGEGVGFQQPDEANIDRARTIIVLPVLDLGQQQALWNDPNPWREIWQAKDYSQHGLNIRVPLGDIADVTDIPDTGFLNGAQYNFASLLNRYAASNTYITSFKNQGSGGVLVSLYRHDGNRLTFIRKMVVTPRAGFRFDDVVPAALQMIIMAHNNSGATGIDPEQNMEASNNAEFARQSQVFNITVPYQSLQQWVAIQNRLRRVNVITAMTPLRVSPSSAQIKIEANVVDINDLQSHLVSQQFELQYLPTGEMVLIEQFR